MKRDMDLIRAILLEIEASDSDDYIRQIQIDGYSGEVINFHIHLMINAGLIDGESNYYATSTSFFHSCIIKNITWDGYDFLDACRDEGIWNDAKVKIKSEVSSVSFDVLKTVLATLGSKAVFAGLG